MSRTWRRSLPPCVHPRTVWTTFERVIGGLKQPPHDKPALL